MKPRSIGTILLVTLLLSWACTASGAAGDASDPFISQSYMDATFSDAVLRDTASAVRFTGEQVRLEAEKNAPVKSTGSLSVRSISAGSSARLRLGDSIQLLSGAAAVEIHGGALVNVTLGAQAVSGKLVKLHRYLACEEAEVTVTFTEDSLAALDGKPELTGNASPFTDVRPGDWFYGDVLAAVERGFITGMTDTTYEPGGKLTWAQCVKLAACMHQSHATGAVTLENSPEGPWYGSYVDYALEKGLLPGEPGDYDAAISRRHFVEIFYRALPESSYPAINVIPEGSIPDTAADAPAAREIYGFYRAGILEGYEGHVFGPDTNIVRAEVATIMNRMFDATARISFGIS